MMQVYDDYRQDPNTSNFRWNLKDGNTAHVTIYCISNKYNYKTFIIKDQKDLHEVIEPLLLSEPYRLSIVDKNGNIVHSESRAQYGHLFFLDNASDIALLKREEEAFKKLDEILKEQAHQKDLARRRARRKALKEQKNKQEWGD